MSPGDEGTTCPRLECGIAAMNRGFTHLASNRSDGPEAACTAYNEAIAILQPLASAEAPSVRNSLGAAWMNLGVAQHRRGTPQCVQDAVVSHQQAVAILRSLPLADAAVYRRNLAAAAMNLANALLDSTAPSKFRDARTSALEALAAIAATERIEPQAADIGLKARRTLCDAAGHLLVDSAPTALNATAVAAEAADVVDDGLALAREWDQRGVVAFRPVAVRLFFFGAQLCRRHQPHFLAEFLSENLVLAESAPAAYRIAALGEILEALAALRRPQLFLDGTAASIRKVETARELTALAARLGVAI